MHAEGVSLYSRTCRLRKLKCDEKLPTCSRCERGGRWCDRTVPLKIREQKDIGADGRKRKKTKGKRQGATKKQTADGIDDHDEDDNDDSDEQPLTAAHHQQTRSARLELLQDEDTARHFEHYIKHLAPWYDLNDLDGTFRSIVSTQALQSHLLLSAIVAFSAMHKSRTGQIASKSVAERHHARCLHLLINLEEEDIATRDGTALAATCLLRSYEILAEDQDPNRHLFGAFSLIPTLSSALLGGPLLRAGLWNYLREDITFSLINRCPLKVSVGETDLPLSRDDDYANQITLLLARVINAVFASEKTPAPLEELQEAVHRWHCSLPFQPYHESHEGVFPKILMIQDCHVSAMHYFHVALLLLNEGLDLSENAENRARIICGLAFSASSDSVMVNAYGPICYSGKWLSRDDDRRELVNRLLDSHKRTGWAVQSIINKLKDSWAKDNRGETRNHPR